MLPLLRGPLDFASLKWRRAHLKGDALRKYQQLALRRLVRLARERSPFYSDLYAGRDVDDFRSLPVIDKAIMMREFDRLNTSGLRLAEVNAFALQLEHSERQLGYFQGRYVVGLSSGTSGARGLYVTDRSISERLPFVFLARSGIPLGLLPFRIAFFLRVFNQAFADINNPLICLRYIATTTPVDEAIERLNGLRANILMGPPSTLRLLARQRDRIVCPIRIVVSYAEVLEEVERSRLERAFGAPVVEIYQASEGLIACPCRAGKLHINEDLVFVELLGEDGAELAAQGIPCRRMIVTNLYNEVQPLIRYALNDLVVLGPACACGSAFRVIDKVIGRDDDVLYFRRAGAGLDHVFPDVMSRWIITASEHILEYAVRQPDPGRVIVDLEVDLPAEADAVRSSVLRALEAGFAALRIAMPTTEINVVGAMARGDGKFKRFRRAYDARAWGIEA